MKSRIMTALCLAMLAPPVAVAAEAAIPGAAPAPLKREIIPGSELMSSQERERYRQRMGAAATPQEQDKVRSEHVKQMQERARVRGLQLADPSAQRREAK